MRGLTRLEVDLLIDASTNVGPPRVAWSWEMNNVCLQLQQRRLITFVCDADGVIRGVITALGKLVLSIALTEPSLIHSNTP